MIKTPYIVGNWKMNLTLNQVVPFLKQLKQDLPQHFSSQLAIATSPLFLATMLKYVYKFNLPIKVGAENCFYKDKGAYTGEVSPYALARMGIKFVIVGHSERRIIFHENHFQINKKVRAVLRNNMTPIICCDEQMGRAGINGKDEWIVDPVVDALRHVPEYLARQVIIAYEPVWAIGASHSASPQEAEEGCYLIRQTLGDIYSKQTAQRIPILYGGSVNSRNIKPILKQKDINGILAGRSSLYARSIVRMVKEASRI